MGYIYSPRINVINMTLVLSFSKLYILCVGKIKLEIKLKYSVFATTSPESVNVKKINGTLILFKYNSFLFK